MSIYFVIVTEMWISEYLQFNVFHVSVTLQDVQHLSQAIHKFQVRLNIASKSFSDLRIFVSWESARNVEFWIQ